MSPALKARPKDTWLSIERRIPARAQADGCRHAALDDFFVAKAKCRGVGFILGVDLKTGESVQLVSCNFDPRCANLPQP
jgi:hypothetical protein